MHSYQGLPKNNYYKGRKSKQYFLCWMMIVISMFVGMIIGVYNAKADDTALENPFSFSTTLNDTSTYSSNQAINMTFLLQKTAGIKAGDQIKISVGKDDSGTAGFDLDSLQINAVSSGNFFDVSTDSNGDQATITLTAKDGIDYASLDKAGVSIYLKPATDDLNQKSTVTYPVHVTYARGTSTAEIQQLHLNVNNVPGTSGGGATTMNEEIFGGLGGLTAPSGFNSDGEDKWDGNFYAYTPMGSDAPADEALLYWYSQNATVAWVQVALPTNADKVPKSFTWTLSTDSQNNPIADPEKLKVYESPDNDKPMANQPEVRWKYDAAASTNGKVVIQIQNLSAADAGRDLNIPFAVTTKSVTDKFIVTSNISNIPNNGAPLHKTAQMMYNSTIGAGFIPTLTVKTIKTSLSNARKMLFNNDSQTLKSDEDVLKQFATASDHNQPHSANQLHFGNGYKYQSMLAYDKIQAGQTYEIPIYASNDAGDTQTKYAKLEVTPDENQLTNLNAEFVDVDGQTSFPNNHFTLTPTSSTKAGDTWDLNKILTYGTVPTGYHVASGTELNGKVQPTVVWGTTTSPVDVYVKKDTTPTPTPKPTPTPTPTPSPTPAPKGTVVYGLKKIYLYQNTTFSTHERRAGYVSKPRVYRPMFVVTGYGHSANGRLRYQVRDVNHLTKNRGKTGYITAQWAYVRPVYYQTMHSTVTVINPRGVNAYMYKNLTAKTRNYKQGTVLQVTKIVKHNLTTRFVLTNGQYITANRKLVTMDKQTQPRYIKVKKAIYRYQDVNLSKRNKRTHFKKGTKIKIKNYDYSHANSVSNHGALRYHVAGGYITGNTKYVKIVK